MRIMEKHPLGVLGIGIIGIALSSIFVKYSTAPSAVTAAWRLLWAVALLTPVVFGNAKIRNELFQLDRKTLIKCCISGMCLAAHLALWFESLQHTSVAASTTIVCTEVIWVALGWWLFQKGKLSGKAILAIGITLAGSITIAVSDLGKGHLLGDLLALIAAMVEAGYTLIGKQVRKRVSTTVYTYVVYSACGGALLLICLATGQNVVGYGYSPVIVGVLLAVFSTIMGHSIFSWCLKFFSPSFVSAAKLCEPVVAAVLAMFLFGQIPGILLVLGGVLILAGVFYYSRIEKGNSV